MNHRYSYCKPYRNEEEANNSLPRNLLKNSQPLIPDAQIFNQTNLEQQIHS